MTYTIELDVKHWSKYLWTVQIALKKRRDFLLLGVLQIGELSTVINLRRKKSSKHVLYQGRQIERNKKFVQAPVQKVMSMFATTLTQELGRPPTIEEWWATTHTKKNKQWTTAATYNVQKAYEERKQQYMTSSNTPVRLEMQILDEVIRERGDINRKQALGELHPDFASSSNNNTIPSQYRSHSSRSSSSQQLDSRYEDHLKEAEERMTQKMLENQQRFFEEQQRVNVEFQRSLQESVGIRIREHLDDYESEDDIRGAYRIEHVMHLQSLRRKERNPSGSIDGGLYCFLRCILYTSILYVLCMYVDYVYILVMHDFCIILVNLCVYYV